MKYPIAFIVMLFALPMTANLSAQTESKTIDQTQDQASEQTQEDATTTLEEFTARVRTIASNANSESRLSALVTILDELEIEYEVEEFEARRKSGKNLIVNIPHSTKADADTITVGAHYDQVQVGQGAIDNACSCAALIELIEQFKTTPLANHSLQIVFFDLEEQGLLGAKAFVKARDEESLPEHFINVDIFGYGDTFWLMSEDSESKLHIAFEEAGEAASIPVKSSPMSEYPPSDHEPFVNAGVPTVGVALIDGEEIDVVRKLLSRQRVAPPKILRLIHTPDDTTEAVEPEESAKGIPMLEAAIRILDANQE